MADLLGDNWRDYLPPEGVDPEAVARFLRDWKINHRTEISGDIAICQLAITAGNSHTGSEEKEGWQFDMQKAADRNPDPRNRPQRTRGYRSAARRRRRTAELLAMNHRDAQKIVSTPGPKDGRTSHLRRAKRQARRVPPLARRSLGMGDHGYRFRILSDKNGFAMFLARKLWSDGGNGYCR
ncbi:DUF2950 family protein [Enterobacter hormaechei]